jgi:MFS family permease
LHGDSRRGWLTDNLSWHWIFLINGPIGALSLVLVNWLVTEPEVLERERRERLAGGFRVDWIGFILVALFLGCLEVVLRIRTAALRLLFLNRSRGRTGCTCSIVVPSGNARANGR